MRLSASLTMTMDDRSAGSIDLVGDASAHTASCQHSDLLVFNDPCCAHACRSTPRDVGPSPHQLPVIGWRNIPASLCCLNTPSGVSGHASLPQIPLYRGLVRRRTAARTASALRAACSGSALRTVRER